MKTLKFTSLALLIMALVSFTGTPISYSSSNDDNHLSANDSVYSPPGYMNKDIQQARSLTDKYLANKDKADNKTEATQREVSQKVQTQAVEKPKPQLKQKQSSKTTSTKAQATITASEGSVKIGTGIQEKDATGRVIAETIDGQRYVYAGFDFVGKATIQDAIIFAKSGDIILIKAKDYYINSPIYLKSGVSLYGGYDENGAHRDGQQYTKLFSMSGTDSGVINATNVNNITMSGISIGIGSTYDYFINRYGAGILVSGSQNISIKASKFETAYGILGSRGSTLTVSGSIFNTKTYAAYLGDASITSSYVTTVIFENNEFFVSGNNAGIEGHGRVMITSRNNNYYGNAFAVWFHSVGYGPIVQFVSTHDYLSENKSWIFGNQYPDVSFTRSESISAHNQYGQTEPIQLTLNTNKNVPAVTLLPYNILNNYMDSMGTFSLNTNWRNNKDPSTLAAIFKNLLDAKNGLINNAATENPSALKPITTVAISQSLLSLPQGELGKERMEIAMRLDSILKNPTGDQRVILDAVKALLADTSKIQEDAANKTNPDLKKAEDDLLNAVANILLAQAVPDLLNKGDVSNIKAMFSELDTQRNKIMLEYAQSTKPYYENMIKDMAKNMAMLQSKNLLNPNMSKDELSKLPPSELDKILDKIRNMKDKSFEEKYLLQQEAKYRQDYLDPNNKKLESDMKGMLNSFTSRINDVLKSSDKK